MRTGQKKTSLGKKYEHDLKFMKSYQNQYIKIVEIKTILNFLCVCPQDEAPGTPKKKETKRKFKLEPHEDQVFLDGNEVRLIGTF